VYDNIDGLNSILHSIELCSYRDLCRVSIVISDDSYSPLLSDENLLFYSQKLPHLHYTWNSPPLGAVANWNCLIQSSQSAYIWLLHHDENPANLITGLPALLKILSRDKPKLLVLPVFKLYRNKLFTGISYIQRHTPRVNFLLAFLQFPFSLLFCNYIGPPSALIVSQSLNYEFDPGFKWHVDVLTYISLLFQVNDAELFVVPSDCLSIISDQSFTASITSTIKSNLPAIKRAEWQCICNRYPAITLFHRAIGCVAYVYVKLLSVFSFGLVMT
jgi:hypothetical protein